jgi:glycosyltransferase involved in cell wall biosynthesis
MRILIASGIFHPETGGPATYLHRLLPEFQARGHTVTVLSFGDAPVAGYPYPLVRIPRRGYLRRQWDYYHAAQRLWPGHDLAYIHSLGLPLPALIRPRIAKIVGDPAWERATRKGWVPPDTDIDHFQAHRYRLPAEVNKTLRAREARRLDHVIVPSQHRKHLLVSWGVDPARVSVIYNAVEFDAPAPGEDRDAARARLGLPDGPLLLTVARLTPLKGIDHILAALARLEDVRLVVAGEGDIRPALEALARSLGVADRVIFLGHVPHEQVRLYFRAADYTILYSGGEGLSHVLLESLSLGTPAIASDKGGNPEVIEHGVNGLLVPYADVEALTAAIREAFAPGRRAALAANAAFGLERFGYARMVEETLAVLERFA